MEGGMRNPLGEPMSGPISARTALEWVGVCGAVVGVVAMIFGLVYAIKILEAIWRALSSPEIIGTHVIPLGLALGGDDLNIPLADRSFPLAKPLAVIILGLGATVCAWLSLGLTLAGVKSIAWLLTDASAVRRILRNHTATTTPARPPSLDTNAPKPRL